MELPTFSASTIWFIVFATIWSTVWKAIALWKAARNTDKPWFIVLMVVNTLGILEIFYVYVFSKRPGKKEIA